MNTTQPQSNTSPATDPDDPYDLHQPLPPALKRVLDFIDQAVARAAAKRNQEELDNVSGALTRLGLTEELSRTARAYYTTRKSQLLAFLEDPHPYGSFRYDLVDNNAYIANGTLIGRQMERLSEMPQRVRDALQHMKSSGGVLVEPHPVERDQSIPTHLEMPHLIRQFRCDAYRATCLQHFFLRLDADKTVVKHYAQEAKTRGFDSIFLELDWTSLHLEALNCACDASDGPDEPCGHCRANEDLVPYEEGRTELGRFATHRASEATDEATEREDDDWPGSFEPIGFHRVHSDHDRIPPDFTHPWIERLRECPREQLPSLLRKAYRIQREQQWSHALSGAFWLEARTQLSKKAPPFVRWALRELWRITRVTDLTRHGKLVWDHHKRWTSSERRLFWNTYKKIKTALTATPTPSQTPDEASAA